MQSTGTSCNCDAGYKSTGATDPFFYCLPGTSTNGIQTQTYACVGMDNVLVR